MAIELREYQTDLINCTRNSLTQGKRNVCVVLGCGG